jgi:acetyl-CoA synthetase
VEWVDAEDPLFLLYTSGSTGKPKVVILHGLIKICPFPFVLFSHEFLKGVLHTTGGYMVYSATTFKYAFDYKPSDIYWYP